MKHQGMIGLLLLAFSVTSANAAELLANTSYRTKTSVEITDQTASTTPAATTTPAASTPPLELGPDSKIQILEVLEDYYAIRVIDPYATSSTAASFVSTSVQTGKLYFLAKDQNDAAVENLVDRSLVGPSSGPMVVPFKYRLDDDSFSGQATLGYYAGYGFDIRSKLFRLQPVTVTPFLSAGLTQVSITKTNAAGESTEENKSGFTWAAGFMINNWDGLNIGLVYGQDRIGDNTWVHEGESWLSISFGWSL